ncbi:MAG TPA: hypothetical protein VFN28_13400 [Amaricoccus sp.]|nr:hypothetical protein [Amaricoccus sp.]
MKTRSTSLAAAAAIALALAAPAVADSGQLAANAGIAPAAASTLTLTEIAQAKFNRDTRGDDRQVIVAHQPASPEGRTALAANAGLSADAQDFTLTEIAAAKFNHDGSGDDQQRIERGKVTVAARSVRSGDRWGQLAAGAGLTTSEAAGLSLTDIARAKFARDTW